MHLAMFQFVQVQPAGRGAAVVEPRAASRPRRSWRSGCLRSPERCTRTEAYKLRKRSGRLPSAKPSAATSRSCRRVAPGRAPVAGAMLTIAAGGFEVARHHRSVGPLRRASPGDSASQAPPRLPAGRPEPLQRPPRQVDELDYHSVLSAARSRSRNVSAQRT